MYKTVKMLTYNGFKNGIKQLSSMTRLKAVGLPSPHMHTRGKTHYALFLASTLARGCIVQRPTEQEIQEEVTNARARLSEERPMPSNKILEALGRFIDRLMSGKKHRRPRTLPLPSTKACYERSCRAGGATVVLKKHKRVPSAVLEAEAMLIAEQNILELPGLPWYVDGTDYNDLTPQWEDSPELVEAKIAAAESVFTTPEPRDRTIAERFSAAVFEGKFNRKAKILPIVQPDAKIRIATLHPSEVLWCARASTQWLMPF
jgi:hypothetical protein